MSLRGRGLGRSLFNRGVTGTYHRTNEVHLGRCCAEFDLCWNTRDMSDCERATEILKSDFGRLPTYRRIDRLAA